MTTRPGGEMASRPLHFIFLCDSSGSMAVNGKIEALNAAIREAIPKMQEVARENVHAQVWVRAIKFANRPEWHIGVPVKVEDLVWTDLAAGGLTALGSALELAADQLKVAVMPPRGLPPVLVLITDGEPTDDYRKGLRRLLAEAWGKHAVRVAIAIGEEAKIPVLEEFIANPEIKPLLAKNADQLHSYIRWASTVVLQAASSPPSVTRKGVPAAGAAAHVPIVAPAAPEPAAAADVW
jgi:uncharacterized protein YegL